MKQNQGTNALPASHFNGVSEVKASLQWLRDDNGEEMYFLKQILYSNKMQ